MAADQAKVQASKDRYLKEKVDRVLVTLPKGKKIIIATHAKARGESLNAFINRAIRETMERDKGKAGE